MRLDDAHGSSAATGIGVAGTPIGVIALGGAKRSTDM